MKSYITKESFITAFDIKNKFYSFLASEHRYIKPKNINIKKILDLLDNEGVGNQININKYLYFKTNYFLGIISCMNNLIFDTKKAEQISKNTYNISNAKLKKGDFLISRNASLGKISYINTNENIILNGGISFLRFKEIYKFYVPAFFITNYGKEFLESVTSGGGTQQNAKRENILNIPIPFPTTKNNSNPQDIEKLISLITQNIIDKEEQIKFKNEKINNLIGEELKNNQKDNVFEYKYPNRDEVFKEGRLDTGVYSKAYKEIEFLIENYKGGVFFFKEKDIKSGNTPKERFFSKGNIWLTPTDCKKGIIQNLNYIKTLKECNLKKDAIIISNRSNVGETVLFSKNIFDKGHHNQGMYRIEFNKINEIFYIFSLCFFNSNIFQRYVNIMSTGSVFKEIKINEITSKFKIPNFPPKKQEEITKEYYNIIEKNINLNLENYLELEKERNSKLGIFQLNMEIFELKDKLEELIDKVINEEEMEVELYD